MGNSSRTRYYSPGHPAAGHSYGYGYGDAYDPYGHRYPSAGDQSGITSLTSRLSLRGSNWLIPAVDAASNAPMLFPHPRRGFDLMAKHTVCRQPGVVQPIPLLFLFFMPNSQTLIRVYVCPALPASRTPRVIRTPPVISLFCPFEKSFAEITCILVEATIGNVISPDPFARTVLRILYIGYSVSDIQSSHRSRRGRFMLRRHNAPPQTLSPHFWFSSTRQHTEVDRVGLGRCPNPRGGRLVDPPPH